MLASLPSTAFSERPRRADRQPPIIQLHWHGCCSLGRFGRVRAPRQCLPPGLFLRPQQRAHSVSSTSTLPALSGRCVACPASSRATLDELWPRAPAIAFEIYSPSPPTHKACEFELALGIRRLRVLSAFSSSDRSEPRGPHAPAPARTARGHRVVNVSLDRDGSYVLSARHLSQRNLVPYDRGRLLQHAQLRRHSSATPSIRERAAYFPATSRAKSPRSLAARTCIVPSRSNCAFLRRSAPLHPPVAPAAAPLRSRRSTRHALVPLGLCRNLLQAVLASSAMLRRNRPPVGRVVALTLAILVEAIARCCIAALLLDTAPAGSHAIMLSRFRRIRQSRQTAGKGAREPTLGG